MLNILVTGGAGFIGSHACKALAKSGYLPVTYDNLSRGHREAVKWGPLEVGDIADAGRVRSVLEKYRPAALMHFAAYSNVGESVKYPLLYYVNNVGGSAVFLKSVVDMKRLPIVFSSTAAVYGIPQSIPIREDHTLRPMNSYGSSKTFVESMLADAGVSHNLPWIALRYFNAAGSDPDQEIGEEHDPETHLIPLILAAALKGQPLQIYGTDYDTPDGTCVRDYVHVADIASAHVRAIEYLLAGGTSSALNLANARGYSVKEVIAAAESICNLRIPVKFAMRRPGDPPVPVGSAERAHNVLGWKPMRSALEVQIGDALKWMSAPKWQRKQG